MNILCYRDSDKARTIDNLIDSNQFFHKKEKATVKDLKIQAPLWVKTKKTSGGFQELPRDRINKRCNRKSRRVDISKL